MSRAPRLSEVALYASIININRHLEEGGHAGTLANPAICRCVGQVSNSGLRLGNMLISTTHGSMEQGHGLGVCEGWHRVERGGHLLETSTW